jgi:glutamyl-tRNA reductase
MPQSVETSAMTLTVFALQEHLESVRRTEIERISRRQVSFRPEQQDAIEELTRDIVTRILHGLTTALEATSTDTEHAALLNMVHRIFKLGKIPAEGPTQNRRRL